MQDTLIDFLRHGQPEGGRRYRGNGVNDPLTDKGREQMWSAVGEYQGWTRIVSSPLVRCAAFGQALAEKHAIPFSTDARFQEVGFGRWEGKSRDELLSRHREEFDAFYADPVNQRPEGAEPLHLFGQRVADGFNALCTLYPGEQILVIAHAGVIRAALGYVMQAPPAAWYRAQVSNACFTRFKKGRHGLILQSHNQATLAGENA